MTITHHPDAATLMSHAAGSLPTALAVVVASHISVCPACRREYALMERLGGVLLAGLAEAPLGKPKPLVSGLAQDAPSATETRPRPVVAAQGEVPSPLSELIGSDLDNVPWRRLLPGVWHHQLVSSKTRRGHLMLLRADPGRALPEHGHGGSELTLVLRGAYSDETGRYERGDCADLDPSIEHRPVADPLVGCICLLASETQPRLKGFLGRLIQPFIGR